jgi:nitrite reductase/ring-hydroxylating ferredoxin subunit
LVNVLVGNSRYGDLSQFPFQPLGLAALVILFLMAATSHDFWLANLSAPVWKSLHMLVYLAYGLVVAHVALGVLQYETQPVLVALLSIGGLTLLGLHLIAGWRERSLDGELASEDGWVDVCAVDDIAEKRGKVVTVTGERLAVFRYDGKISALSNVCQHQNGPLGEGKVVDGLVVCPWHGYQYKPDCGASPEPFNEKIPTFAVRVAEGRVWVNPRPNPPGTHVPPAIIPGSTDHG